ncbi:MAG: ABC transporter ATP-binding protein [Actinomycetota bacterium]
MRLLRLLLSVLSEDYGRKLKQFVATEMIAAALAGFGFVLLVPTLGALLEDDTDSAWGWLAAMVAAFLLYAVVAYQGKAAGFAVGSTVSRALHRRLGAHIVRLPLGWFGARRLGSMGVLASKGVVDVMGVPAHLARALISALVTPVTVVLAMFVFDWRLALAALVSLPVLALAGIITGALIGKADKRSHAARAEANGRVVEFATHQAVLRAFGQARSGDERLEASLEEQRKAGRALLLTAVPGFAGFAAAVQVAFGVVFIIGVQRALGGGVSVAELVALLVLVVRFVEPILVAADLAGALRVAENSLARFDELLSTPPLPQPSEPQTPSGNDIVFTDVGFGYEPDTPVLDGVGFHLPQGSVTALVGASGSGKTTVTRLIARFWDVDEGSVSIGGVDVRQIASEDLLNRLSLVFQDVYLFEGTILDNIRLARADATDEEVMAAGRAAAVDEITDRLPDGWHTSVGEGGSRLSGGERQRVAIARAILKDAPIVLLDEATAALDPANELLIARALAALLADRTVLVIAHRLHTVQAADQILVLDEGRIVESGTHDELLARDDGRYAGFWRRRSQAKGWRLRPTADVASTTG